jgi:enoyl-CoA hydratase/carnithine racemase
MPRMVQVVDVPVQIEVVGSVGYLTLNRPHAYNAITTELARTLDSSLRELAERADVVVIRGAGGNFSVGGDFKELERLRSQGEDALRELFESFGRACATAGELPVPVIAAVEGYAVAGGFELMLACDIALVRTDAKLGDNHSNFGQVPGGGSSQRLPRLVGAQRALGLILSGERISGAQAVDWGLAYRAFSAGEFEAGVQEFAQALAGKDRVALSRSKRLVRDGLELPLSDGLALELRTVLAHLADAGAGAGIERFTKGG